MKSCSMCREELPDSAFAPRRRQDRKTQLASACRPCENRRQKQRRIEGKSVTYLPVEPFRQWLEERMDAYDTSEDFAFALGTRERRIWEWRHRSQKVSLDVVDRALTHEGTTTLEELYPFDLYPA